MQGTLLLLITAWVVSDNPPGSERGMTAFVTAGLGMVALFLPVLLLVQEGDPEPGIFLQLAGWHLLPFAPVLLGAAAWMQDSAYAVLARLCVLELAAALALLGLGALVRALRRRKA